MVDAGFVLTLLAGWTSLTYISAFLPNGRRVMPRVGFEKLADGVA